MKRLMTILLAVAGVLAASAQTLNVTVGDVIYQFPAAQAGEMTYAEGTTLTIMNKVFNISDIDNITIDNTSVTDNLVKVSYEGTSAKVTVAGNVAQYVTPTVKGAYISIAQSNTDAVDNDEITYQLSGNSSDGQFALSGSYKCTVSLAGLDLTCATGSPINITNSKRIQLSAKKNTTNTLADCANGKQKACIYSKGQLQLQGNGTLNVVGNTKHAVKSASYVSVKNLTLNITSTVGDGISCEEYFLMKSGTVTLSGIGDDGIQCDLDADKENTGEVMETADVEAHDDENTGNVYLEGGTLNVSVTADAAKAVKGEGDMKISGGTITCSTSGNGIWSEDTADASNSKTKASSCLSADGNMVVSGGTLNLTSTGHGGKGISVDGTFSITDGTITISTAGGRVVYYNNTLYNGTFESSVNNAERILDNLDSNYKSSAKGIKADGNVTLDGGTINVTTTGVGAEGIESKGVMIINGGAITCNTYDDGINSSGDMTVNGGYIYARATNNDGLDANGNLYIKGGLVYAIGAGGAEKSIDANTEAQKKLYIQGGTIIAVGDLENGASISGGTCKYTSSWTGNSRYALYNGGTLAAVFTTPTKSGSSGGGFSGGGGSQKLIVYTSSTPTLYTSGTNNTMTVSGGTAYFDGKLLLDATVSGGSNVSLTNYSSSSGGRF